MCNTARLSLVGQSDSLERCAMDKLLGMALQGSTDCNMHGYVGLKHCCCLGGGHGCSDCMCMYADTRDVCAWHWPVASTAAVLQCHKNSIDIVLDA